MTAGSTTCACLTLVPSARFNAVQVGADGFVLLDALDCVGAPPDARANA